ncbi:hypothetical protein AYI68_g5887 [Smittium mucronatum]|uniref:Uncharacterized protein n=1 Tax=Smittium mucronatum TaxID=133383 RepID=A0A1R0GT00_9FUNG|nr:hypothetical protein AYI68_g5887 [Smittium mucronatum]
MDSKDIEVIGENDPISQNANNEDVIVSRGSGKETLDKDRVLSVKLESTEIQNNDRKSKLAEALSKLSETRGSSKSLKTDQITNINQEPLLLKTHQLYNKTAKENKRPASFSKHLSLKQSNRRSKIIPINSFLVQAVSDTEKTDKKINRRPKTFYLDTSIKLTSTSTDPINTNTPKVQNIIDKPDTTFDPSSKSPKPPKRISIIQPDTPILMKPQGIEISDIQINSVKEPKITRIIKFLNPEDFTHTSQNRPFFKDSDGKPIEPESLSQGNQMENSPSLNPSTVGLIDAEEEDPFSFNKWSDLIDLHSLSNTCLIIARPLDSRLVIENIEYFVVSVQSPINPKDYVESLKKKCHTFSRIHLVISPEFFWEDQITSSNLSQFERLNQEKLGDTNLDNFKEPQSEREHHTIDIDSNEKFQNAYIKQKNNEYDNGLNQNAAEIDFRSSITISEDNNSSINPDDEQFIRENSSGSISEKRTRKGSKESLQKQRKNSSFGKIEKSSRKKSKLKTKRISRFLETGDISQLGKIDTDLANSSQSFGNIESPNNTSKNKPFEGLRVLESKGANKDHLKTADKSSQSNSSIYSNVKSIKSRLYSPIDHGQLTKYLLYSNSSSEYIENSDLNGKNNGDISGINMDKESLSKKNIINLNIVGKSVGLIPFIYEATFLCNDSEFLARPSLRDYFYKNELDPEYSMKILVKSSFENLNDLKMYSISLPHPRVNGARIVIADSPPPSKNDNYKKNEQSSNKETIPHNELEASKRSDKLNSSIEAGFGQDKSPNSHSQTPFKLDESANRNKLLFICTGFSIIILALIITIIALLKRK